MARKPSATAAAATDDDLLGGKSDDLLAGKPKGKKAAAKTAAAEKPAAKKAAAKTAEKPAAAEKPARTKKAAAPAADRSARGTGKFYMEMDEKADLAKKIGAGKKPATTAELAEKFGVETWKVRRAINEILVKEGKGTVEKVGTTLTYKPA